MNFELCTRIKYSVATALVAVAGFAGGTAHSAVLVTYSDLASFSAAAGGGLQMEDFSGYAPNSNLSGVSILPGISVTTNMTSLQVFGGFNAMFGLGGRTLGTARYDIAVAQPYKFIAFDITSFESRSGDGSTAQGPGTLSVFFADTTSQTIDIFGNSTGADIFVGLASDTAITGIRWAEALEVGGVNEETALDNFRVQTLQRVPEPASLALLALGIGALGLSRRKRA